METLIIVAWVITSVEQWPQNQKFGYFIPTQSIVPKTGTDACPCLKAFALDMVGDDLL